MQKYKASDITKYLNQAEAIALKILEQKARKILIEHPNLHEFVMGMGTWFFIDKNKNHFTEQEVAYLIPFERFILKYDNDLKLTGNLMRFTAKGKIVRDR
jgi:hypothetical protein